MGTLKLVPMGCGASTGGPPPSPDGSSHVRPADDSDQPVNAWAADSLSSNPQAQSLGLSSPPPANPDSVSAGQNFPGQLLQLDEAVPGPVLGSPNSDANPGTRPSSADKIRPTTAGPKRASKSRPSSAGRSRDPGTLLRPTVWLERKHAVDLHATETQLPDVFGSSGKRPSSAGRKRRKNPSPLKSRVQQNNNNRPASAERRNEDNVALKNSIWLEDKRQPNVV